MFFFLGFFDFYIYRHKTIPKKEGLISWRKIN